MGEWTRDKSAIYDLEVEWKVCLVDWPGWGMTEHLKVRRVDGSEGIPWDVLQMVKNTAFGPTVAAVEIYPDWNDVVDDANMRHLWRVPDELRLPNLAK